MTLWQIVFTKEAQKDALRLSSAGLQLHHLRSFGAICEAHVPAASTSNTVGLSGLEAEREVRELSYRFLTVAALNYQ